LEVIYTPGHTPDSIALYARYEKRIFVGDTIYPYTAIHLDCIGSNIKDYISSLKKLASVADLPKLSVPQKQNQPTTTQKRAMDDFLSLIGLNKSGLHFNLVGLMELCDWSVNQAVDFYLNSSSEIETICPKIVDSSLTELNNVQSDVMLSCGHVEANYSASNLQQMLDVLNAIGVGALDPISVDGEYMEYTCGNITILMSRKQISDIQQLC